MIPAEFEEVELSRDYTAVAKGGPKFLTAIVGEDQPVQQRNVNWYDPVRQFEIQFGGLSPDQLMDLEEFFLTKWGMAIGFRFFAPTDNRFRNDLIATVVGDEEDFPLKRVYKGGTRILERRIVKPVPDEVSIYADNVPLEVEMNWNTGRFTVPGGLGGLVGAKLTARGYFNIPVFFGSDHFNPDVDTTFADLNSVPITEMLPITLGIE